MMRRMFSSGSSSHSTTRTAYHEPVDGALCSAEVKACQWPSETFMTSADVKQEFEQFVKYAGLTAFLADKGSQYYHLTDTFVQDFKFISSHTAPRVVFHLNDKPFSMSLEEFYYICKIPFWGSFHESRKRDYDVFLRSVCNGETSGVTQGRIGSIHFPAVHYFALFIGRCLGGKHDLSATCAPDLSILHSALHSSRTYNMGGYDCTSSE
jgi:hypothetical protein